MQNQQFLTFLGGAGTVTGSKILIEADGKKILVDCGLFQGLKELRLLNRSKFPVNPAEIDAVVLTHAHLDHCGYIPVLVKNGFRGTIHCTHPTRELTEIILKDSAKIQEEDAERASLHSYSKHENTEPLYTVEDVIKSLPHFKGHNLNEWVILNNEVKFEFLNSGHILGSAFVNAKIGENDVLFTGDIGRSDPLLLYPPKKIKQADYIVLESTYGDRLHDHENADDKLLDAIKTTFNRQGILMIPSFAVERTQEILFLIHQLRAKDKMPPMKVYLDTPMGINASNVYKHYTKWQHLPEKLISDIFHEVLFINDVEQSKHLVEDKHSKIIIAGSGMLQGGRILHYLNTHGSNPDNMLLFVGYQGEGTRGRAILNGSKEIKFFGEYHSIKCEIRHIDSLSAHADYLEMIDWLKNFHEAPKKIILNHGEPHQTNALRVRIEHELHWNVATPVMMESIVLE